MSWEEIKNNMNQHNGRYIEDTSNIKKKKTIESSNEGMNLLGELFNRTKNSALNSLGNVAMNQIGNVFSGRKSNATEEFKNSFLNYMINGNAKDIKESVAQDILGLTNITAKGVSTGNKEVFNYIESMTENKFNNYKTNRENQFLTSLNVSEEDKAKTKMQNNLLLSMNGINNDEKIETNLVKKAIRDSINKDNEKIQEEQSKMSNQATKKLAEIAPSMGQMLPGMALNAVNPILGTAYFTTSAGGGYIDDALNRGMNEQQAFKYGTVMGALEGASESIITGQQLSKVKKAFTGKAISKKLLNSYGFNIFENAVQEAVMEPAQEITAGIVGDKADWSNMGERMLESGFNGALMGAISNGVTFGLEKSGNVYDKIKNGENITETEYKEALQENINKFGKNAVENAMKNGATEVYQEINNIQQQSTQSEQILPIQQISQEQNNVAQNGNMEQVLPTQKYYYKKSDNVKIDNLRQDVNKYFDNSEKTHNFVNMLEKIIEDKDISIRLDENLTDTNGNIANGKYENGTITINPNSDRAGEFIAIHELTHAIGTDSMRNIIENYRKSNTEFDNAVKSLLENYNTTELTDEAMADVSAQLFGNQEYINNLAQENPNLFKRIYNEIKYLWHQFRGYKNQNEFIEDLQYKWEQAYRSNNELNNTTNYHISKNFSTEIDKSLKGQIPSNNQVKARDYTPKILVNNGVQDLPMLLTQRHLRQIIYTQQEAEALGYRINKKDHYHGLGKETLINAIDNMDNPSEIYKQSNKNYLIITELKDSNNNPIIVPIEVNGTGTYNDVRILENQISTVYGHKKLNKYLSDNNFTKIYEKNRSILNGEGVKSHDSISASNNSISSTQENVNSSTTNNNSMQESENNSDSFNLSESRKQKQNEIIQENNPMNKELGEHTWINSAEDIKTYQEAIEEFGGIDNITPDFTAEDIKKALNTGEVTVYSSYPIKQGTFVTPSKMEAQSYAGNNQVYSKEVKLNDVAWIDEIQGQYAQIEESKITTMDNKGRKLSKEQQEFFKDSKVRDENGNLLIMYHGTPNGNYNEFNEGTYFTSRKEYADGYQNPNASMLTTKQDSSNPKTYEVYLNIKNPFSIQDERAKRIYLDEYVKGGNSLYLDPYTDYSDYINALDELDWTEGEDLREWLKENHPEYDGLVLDEGGDGGYGEAEYKWRGKSYVPFNSNQIKNVDNLNPTDSPDIRYSKNNQEWQEYLDKNIESKGTKTNLKEIRNDNIAPEKELNKNNNITIPTKEYFENKQKIDSLTDKDYEVLNKIYEKEGRTEVLPEKRKASLLEKYANDKYTFKDSLDILAQKIVNKGHYIDKLAEKTNNLELKYVYDKNLNSFAEGQYEIGVAQTDNKGNKIGKSINEIWKPVEDSKLTKEFSEYLLHKHNIDRSGKNKFIFGKEIGPTESTKIALDLERKHPEFKKYAEDIKKFNHNNLNSLKEAGLLTQDTIDYIENMYPNYIAISRNMEDSIYNGSDNETGTRAPLKKAIGGNSDIQPIKDTMAQQVIRIKRLINQNELGKQLANTLENAQIDEGVDIELSPTLLMDMDTMVDTDNKGNKFYLYFEDGKQKKLKINDNLYESLRPTEISRLEKTLPVKALQKITSVHRSLLTSNNPLFIVTNFFKDFQDGMFNSKYSSKFIKNYGKALNEILTKGKYYESYMANGGMSNTYFDYNEGIKKQPNKFIEKIRNANEIVEQLPRMAEFISTLEDGKSLNEALYNAAEITTNFKRGGDLAKALNRNGANFLNASIQGLDKQFRNFSGQNGAKGYVNLLAKATIMSIVPSILNHMLLDGDEDYEDLPESTKDLYYLFKYDDGKFIRIPKGRVLSVFGAAARRTLETIQGDKDVFEGLGQTIANQVAPNNPLEDNILAPITQVSNNKTWYGSDLVSSRLQKELPENQYDETTDEFSKWLGKQLKMSPKKINYLIDQYSGGIGDVLLPAITPQAKENVIVDKFTTDSVLKNKNVSKFYDTLEKQTQIANDSFATDEDSLQLKYLNSISSEMSDLYKEKREIQMSNISNTEKTKKVREVQSKINELAEKGLGNYSKITKKSNSAKVGDQEYYKDSKGNWKLLDEDEKEKIGNLSLETYSKYKQQVYKETQNKKASGELTENQELKDNDKIQILLDYNYSEKEIKSIYESQIKSSKDTQYNIIDKTGIDIKEYLKYKQQNFESDKEDDGTLSGKTVSGSKKDKIVRYLNTMNITGNQRLMLYSLNGYMTTTNQKSQLVKYINTLELDKNQKIELYNKLSGFTVYKNGIVKY